MLFYANPILIAAAVLPAIFLLVQIYRADKLSRMCLFCGEQSRCNWAEEKKNRKIFA